MIFAMFQEALVQEKYRNAILKLANDDQGGAKAIFEELLECRIVKEVSVNLEGP